MKISRRPDPSTDMQWDGWHVITVAESGFSMLDIFGSRRYGIDRDALRCFEEKINATNESGSLHPQAPISAIPRKFLRELSGSTQDLVLAEFRRHFLEFISANERTIRAARILVELHVSPQSVPEHYVQAVEDAFRASQTEGVVRAVVIAV